MHRNLIIQIRKWNHPSYLIQTHPAFSARYLSTGPSSTPSTSRSYEIYQSEVTDPWINLAFEEWLFRRPIELSPDYTLFFYRNDPCIVIGRNQNPWRECNIPLMTSTSLPLVRRRSGGGTVYHDLGNTNYSITMPRADFSRSYFADLIADALNDMDIPAKSNARHDIIIQEKKVSGSAYKVVNAKAYHHGTMLIDTDTKLVSKYLKPTILTEKIEGRGVTSVRSEVTTLRNHSLTVNHTAVCEAIARRFILEMEGKKHLASNPVNIEDSERNPAIKTLTMSTFESTPQIQAYRDETLPWDWTFGQTPQFNLSLSQTFSFGTLTISMDVIEGVVKSCQSAGSDPDPVPEHMVQTVNGMMALWVVGKRFGEVPRKPSEFVDPDVEDVWNWFIKQVVFAGQDL
ncbi:Biotin/lipoate A/B protein ligase [Phlyctochytrium planicorne]|nr:Biotin/lipoate A/B protein ligase [Phlyctochytrium planicorne]